MTRGITIYQLSIRLDKQTNAPKYSPDLIWEGFSRELKITAYLSAMKSKESRLSSPGCGHLSPCFSTNSRFQNLVKNKSARKRFCGGDNGVVETSNLVTVIETFFSLDLVSRNNARGQSDLWGHGTATAR